MRSTAKTIRKKATQACPICGVGQELNLRYPRYLCRKCAAQASDKMGQRLEFFNTDLGGGFQAKYSTTGKVRKSHICFVEGVRCWADEARFGGIVIQTDEPLRKIPRASGHRPIRGRRGTSHRGI